MSSQTSNGSGGKVSRACDACRVRKVRCSGDQPCAQCSHLNLACNFAPAPPKRKPGVRGRLVAQLRNKSSSSTSSITTASSPPRGPPSCPPTCGHSPSCGHGLACVPPCGAGATIQPGSVSGGDTPSAESSPTAPGPPPPPPPVPVTSIAGIVDGLTSSPRSDHPYTIAGCGFSAEYFLGLLPEFEELVYPVNPVLTPAEIRAAIHNMHHDYEDAALVHAFGAVTINLTKTSWTRNGCDVATQMNTLMQYCFWAHRKAEMAQAHDGYGGGGGVVGAAGAGAGGVVGGGGLHAEFPVTVKRIMTCIWLEISFMAFKRFDRSFTILREAIAMVQMMNLHQYHEGDPRLSHTELCRRQRMYWEMYIHERFLFIISGYPCTMVPLRTGLPFLDDSIPVHVAMGWNRLILLFQNIDDSFLAHWAAQQDRDSQSSSSSSPPSSSASAALELTSQWIESKQAQIDQDESDALEAEKDMIARGYGALVELQHVDLFITRLWLRTLVWQLALSKGLLRSAPTQNTHEGLSLHFPAQRLSAQLRNLVSRLGSISSVVFHGSGILQKLFEITSTVADVLALPRGVGQSEDESRTRLEDFFFLVHFIFRFEKSQKHQRDYLREKLEVLQQMYTVVDFRELAGASPTTSETYDSISRATQGEC
ncbi:hypothetical protein E4U43_002374 [Claviceps pusilla]|uniref:Zn(2)-C6 fungal-type domain-containing protein n=1 Tax=Claviceps pusilla TaxID=123648 RepID=A0A9P7N8F8_9HYPO|nr:hypothetical protein E4U43_002374 [Claviceps pusilla]